jgi:hypothetical protein
MLRLSEVTPSQALETLALDRANPLCSIVRVLSNYRGSNFLMVTHLVFSYWRRLSRQNADKIDDSGSTVSQWKRLEEVVKEIANEEKRASEKKKRAVERSRKGKGAGANQPSILSKLKPVAKSRKQSEMPVNSPSSVGEEHGDGVCSGDRDCDEGLSSEKEQHGDGHHSVVGVAEVQNQDVGKSSEDVCGTEKCEVSVAWLNSQYMNMTGENRCPDVVMRLGR